MEVGQRDRAAEGGRTVTRRLANADETDRSLAAIRHRRKPVFVAPFAGEVDYAVSVAAPSVAFLERTDRCAFSRAVSRFDASRLRPPGTAGAGIA